MGQFAEDVRQGMIAGPNERRFELPRWNAIVESGDADEADRELAVIGCFFDDLFKFLRSSIRLAELGVEPLAIVRWLAAHAGAGLMEVHSKSRFAKEVESGSRDMYINRLVQEKMEIGENRFSPDELLTGVGDGLKHSLRQLAHQKMAPGDVEINEVSYEQASEIHVEMNLAIVYQVAVEIWLDCKGNGYRLAKVDGGILISARDHHEERARAVSNYRRLTAELQEATTFLEYWSYRLPAAIRRKAVGIGLVTRIFGEEKISKIELGHNAEAQKNASAAVGSRVFLRNGHYGSFMSEVLPNFKGFMSCPPNFVFQRSMVSIETGRTKSAEDSQARVHG